MKKILVATDFSENSEPAIKYAMNLAQVFNAEIHNVSKTKVENCIQKVGLTPEAHKKISQLSKGYKRSTFRLCATCRYGIPFGKYPT